MSAEDLKEMSRGKRQSFKGKPGDTTIKVTTNVEVTEYEMADPVGKELEEALQRQKEQARQTFQRLVNENVRLEKRLKDVEEEHQELKTQNELLKMDLKTEKSRNSDLERKNKENSAEIQTLTIASKKRNLNKKRGNDLHDDLETTQRDTSIAGPEDTDQRIQDLRLRLIRLALDEEEKDRRIEELERELKERERFSEEVQKHVDKDQMEEIQAKLAESPKEEPVKYQEKTNYVRQSEGTTKSKVCVIMWLDLRDHMIELIGSERLGEKYNSNSVNILTFR